VCVTWLALGAIRTAHVLRLTLFHVAVLYGGVKCSPLGLLLLLLCGFILQSLILQAQKSFLLSQLNVTFAFSLSKYLSLFKLC
jgi:hypothetical protein